MSKMNKELEQEAERVRKQIKNGYLVFLTILLVGLVSLAYSIMKYSYAFEIVFFISFIAVMIVIKYLPIISLPAGISKLVNSILLLLGFIIIFLVFSTILTEFYIHPPEYEPILIGILHRYGIQIKYAVLTSASLFAIVILLNKKETWRPPMIFARFGLLVLLAPFVLLYLLLFYGELKSLIG